MTTADRFNVVVVGMPRSGTSLAASLFVNAGYYPGPRQREASEANPFGYFQSQDLMALNVGLFHQVGFPFHNTWLYDRMADEVRKRIDDLPVGDEHRQFLAHCGQQSPWVWKDPRMCMTLGFWRKVLDLDSTRIILVRREPAAIYHSFVVQNWLRERPMSREEVYERIEQHVAAAREALDRHRLPFIEIWYEKLLAQPDPIVAQVNAFTRAGIRAERSNIRPDLNHSSRRRLIRDRVVDLTRRWPRTIRAIRSLLPRRLVYLVFPERRYLRAHAASPVGGPVTKGGTTHP
jgi:hypothetical protein